MNRTLTQRTLTIALGLTLAACEGRVSARPGDGVTPTRRDGGGADAAVSLPPFAPVAATMHRLTRAQYGNSVRDLLGAVNVPTDLELDTQLYGFATVGAASITAGRQHEEAIDFAGLVVGRFGHEHEEAELRRRSTIEGDGVAALRVGA